MKNAVIITGNSYPAEDAGAIRQHSFALILKKLGYKVFVAGYGSPTNNKVCKYDGVEYISFRKNTTNKLRRAVLRYFFVERVIRYLNKHQKKIDLLFIVDVLPKDFKKIESLAFKHKATLIHDSVEWYSPEEFENGVKNSSYRNKEYTNLQGVRRGWRVVAISKLLEEHFTHQCDAVVRIPVIMDIDSIRPRLESFPNEKLKFVYVGGPGRKDYLKEIVQSFGLLLPNIQEKVELHIVGVDREQLISKCGVNEDFLFGLNNVVFTHGRLPHEEAIKWVREADYTVLLRDENLRYAKAGFPTKIVESMAFGTPPVCNLSSDLGLYLKDQYNCFVVDGHNASCLSKVLKQIVDNYETEDLTEMRLAARKTAEQHFDWKKYIIDFERILK